MAKVDSRLILEIAALRQLTVGELRERYHELFGEETRCRNKDYLFKRIAYRLQELKHGGLSERARARAEALAEDTPLRRRAPKDGSYDEVLVAATRDLRLPPTGTVLRRAHAGVEHEVTVLESGFEYRGKRYSNLSSIAREITGTRWNGYGFFSLLPKGGS